MFLYCPGCSFERHFAGLFRVQCDWGRALGHIQINVAIVVVVDKCHPGIGIAATNARRLCHFLECRIFLIVKQRDPVTEGDSQVRRTVIVIVRRRAANPVRGGIESSFPADILELSVT